MMGEGREGGNDYFVLMLLLDIRNVSVKYIQINIWGISANNKIHP